jgi:hypothetical protein
MSRHAMKMRFAIAILGLVAACALAAIITFVIHERGRTRETTPLTLTYEELTGSVFTPPTGDPFRVPKVRVLQAPDFPGAIAIWGSTGRDSRGHIWFGISACCDGGSARLYEFVPQSDAWLDHGSVTDQLKATGAYRQGEGQIKIHSRIVPAGDGRLYFVSTDEEGEKEDGSVLPHWGSHLWSIDPESGNWQHLMSAPEGLIAVAGVGRYVYALGYWNHTLYQYDTLTSAIKRREIGSVGGHISRNFISDARGHAFVPRVRREADGSLSAWLIELDNELHERAATPLDAYFGKGATENNEGITGLAYIRDGRIVFLTSRGFLYALDPINPTAPDEPRNVRALGWMHPKGEGYVASLFSLGDNASIAAVFAGQRGHEWVLMDLRVGISAAFPIDTKDLKDVLLYGSIARDNSGRAYAVGWYSIPRGKGPLVLQIEP